LGLADHNTTFDADEGRRVVANEIDQVPYKKAARYLGVGRHQLIALIKAELIETVGSGNPLKARNFVSKTRVKQFLDRLTTDLQSTTSRGSGRVTIAEAARRANCSQMVIVNLILDRKLKRIGKLKSKQGYKSILVDVAEIRLVVHGVGPEALGLLTFANENGIKKDTARALVRHGFLRSIKVDRVGGQARHVLIEVAEAEAFRRKYVSLGELGRASRKGYRVIKRGLGSHGVLPAFDPQKIVGHIFDRVAALSALRAI
jgi:hypothetical protein